MEGFRRKRAIFENKQMLLKFKSIFAQTQKITFNMILLDCLIGLLLSILLLNPLLAVASKMFAKQLEYEKRQILMADGERALELMGRVIRMAGYTNIDESKVKTRQRKTARTSYISIEKKSGYRGSDSFQVQHGIAGNGDLDCIGNVLSADRTRKGLALQGFRLDYPKGTHSVKDLGGSLICQSLDRQGRMQHSTLMNGVNQLLIEELLPSSSSHSGSQKLYRIKLQMTDGRQIYMDLERIFATRNLL